MRFWIVDGGPRSQCAVDAICKAVVSGKCKTERRVEAIAHKYGCTVSWVDGYDQNGNRLSA